MKLIIKIYIEAQIKKKHLLCGICFRLHYL